MKNEIIQFWFKDIERKQWWEKSDAFDQLLIDKYKEIHAKACQCELYQWRESPKGRLAEVIILDQFSRNMYRDTKKAFASDSLALVLAQEAIAMGADDPLSETEKSFLYMPFMHSESLVIHEAGLKLFQAGTSESSINFEIRHKKIIEEFGRYPHRNNILGRISTKEENRFLDKPGSSF
ncbi:MAG: hypothetical protein COB38_05430 [Gammaproteobacteria bacterium]|nr:MAG: hypothetical protein COB38_05430 [Gammaproteobacteria bacterium]